MKTLIVFFLVAGSIPIHAQYDSVITEQNQRIANEKILRKLDEQNQPTATPISIDSPRTPEERALLLERLRLENELKRQQIEQAGRKKKYQHKLGPDIASKGSSTLETQTLSPSALADENRLLKETIAQLEKENQRLFEALVDESQAKAQRFFPVIKDSNHVIHKVANRIWDQLEAANDDRIKYSDAPFLIYQMAAKELGIPPAVIE